MMSNSENRRWARTRHFVTLSVGALLLTGGGVFFLPIHPTATAQDVKETTVSDQTDSTKSIPSNDPADSHAMTPAMLQAREDVLMDQLAGLQPSAPDYQTQLQAIGAELRQIQNRLQNFRQVGSLTPSETETFGAPPLPPEGEANVSTPPPLAENGWPTPSPFDEMDAGYLARLKEELTAQLKQLQQTLAALGPQDVALTQSLKEQQTELLDQLKAINDRLGETTAKTPLPPSSINKATAPPLPTDFPFPEHPVASPALSSFPAQDAVTLNAATERIRKANDAAVLLREAGLNQLANQALNQATSLSDPTFSEGEEGDANSVETDEAWFGSDNKNQKILDQIAELKKANDEMKTQLTEITEELKNIETQLKLLSRQAVAGPANNREK